MFYYIILSVVHYCFKLYANSVGPDQSPRSATSVLGLHRLALSFYWTFGFNR